MKRIIFTLLLLWSFIAKAHSYQASALTLTMFDNAAFTLTFDNNTYNTPSNTYNIHDIMPGNHFMQVVKMANSYGPGHCAMPVVVYSGYVNVPAASQVYASVSGINQLTINSVYPLYTVNSGGCNGNNGYNGYNGNTQYGPVPAYMSDADFNALKNSVDSKSFDSSKLTVAKQAVASDRLTSRQVAELMDLFSFESTKLDLAKYSYRHVVDPQNYYVVNDSFTFSSSITELDQYIAKN